MPVSRKSATAFVQVRGLGITCFNTVEGRNETAIIRNGNHKLSVRVMRPEFEEVSGKDAFRYAEIELPDFDPADVTAIEIGGAQKSGGCEIFLGDGFDRLDYSASDENDFRWIVNLEGDELHGAGLESNAAFVDSRPAVTRLHIDGGLYYAVMPSASLIAKTPYFDKKDPRTGKSEPFGYLAETMGVNLDPDEVLVTISCGDVRHTVALKRHEGLPYKIEISNVDPDPDAMLSDLPVCYQFLRDKDGLEFELVPQDEASDSGGPVIGRNFCHLARVNKSSIDSFV